MAPTQHSCMTSGRASVLDNTTRGLLTSGTLAQYIDELSITGFTSNPTVFGYESLVDSGLCWSDLLVQPWE